MFLVFVVDLENSKEINIDYLLYVLIKPMSSYFRLKNMVLMFFVFLWFLSFGFSAYEDFLSQLQVMWITSDDVQNKPSLTRYELTRLLNAVQCIDCIKPDEQKEQFYSEDFWNNFTNLPGKDFGDVSYLGGVFQDLSYYYCVAYVGDQDYMRWYPKELSNVCWGLFCGQRSVTKAEFVQVIINLIWQYIYTNYKADWTLIKNRMDWLQVWSNQYDYLDENDRGIISAQSQICSNNSFCQINNVSEFKTYLKFCMYNLEDCDMQSFGSVWQAVRPVAELNILYKQKIIDAQEAGKWDIYQLVVWEKVLDILYKIFEIIGCEFNNDYDCDWVNNFDDNCPNNYNPTQLDIDEDWQGNVCDDDIDWDGILNPRWVVDDLGYIDISLLNYGYDNCLFVQNPNQEATKSDKIWDLCLDANEQNIAFYIDAVSDFGLAPMTVTFDAVTKWVVQKISWNMWDWTFLEWQKVSHTFLNPWVYVVSARADWLNSKANAKATVVVWDGYSSASRIQIKADKLWWANPFSVKFTTEISDSVDFVQWIFKQKNKTIQKSPTDIFTEEFSWVWNFDVVATARKWDRMIAKSSIVVWWWVESKWFGIQTESLFIPLSKEIPFSSKVYWIRASDISFVEWIWWDWETDYTSYITSSHSYTVLWQKFVRVIIHFNDWSKLESSLSLFVYDQLSLNSYFFGLYPQKLWLNKWEYSNFYVKTVWNFLSSPDSFLNYQSDFSSSQHIENPKIPFEFKKLYLEDWSYSNQSTLFLNECQVLDSQTTVVVQWQDFCMQNFIDGTNSKFKCDRDEDGIADICDTDIDWDWIVNLLWVISSENTDCSLDSWNLNLDILKLHNAGICSLDNCLFDSNESQSDLNLDWIWDVCNDFVWNILDDISEDENSQLSDIDKDWIPDELDSCPELPENYNWVRDIDGCPEVWLGLNCNKNQTENIFDDLCNSNWSCEPSEWCNCVDCQSYEICGSICNNDWFCGLTEGCDCPDCNWDLFHCPTGMQCSYPHLSCLCVADYCETCGNWAIDSGENCFTCPEDVGECITYCGNWVPEVGETCENCPEDLWECGLCWNWVLNEWESCMSCPEDVGDCISYCGNWVPEVGETCENCPEDLWECGLCWNWVLNEWESCMSCPEDVGECVSSCWNWIPEVGEICEICPEDVGECGLCWNWIVNELENCMNCPEDVGECVSSCWNWIPEIGETCEVCPEDLGSNCNLCGNWVENELESCTICPIDFDSCVDSYLCWNWIPEIGETCEICPQDMVFYCSSCGDNNIDVLESCEICSIDLGDKCINCWNETYDDWETCQDCPSDLWWACWSVCGNWIKELTEECDLTDWVLEWEKCNNQCQIEECWANEDCDNECDWDYDWWETCQDCPSDLWWACWSVCGNWIKELTEECDLTDWVSQWEKCNNQCQIEECGTNEDCDNDCDWNYDWWETCQDCPSDLWWACWSVCGNWIKELTEDCDLTDWVLEWEKCNSQCHIEECGTNEDCYNDCDWNYDWWETCQDCPQDVGLCGAECGNWIKELDEDCDKTDWVWPGEFCTENCEIQNACNNNWVCDYNESCDCWDCENNTICSLCGNWNPNDPWENCATCPIDAWVCPTSDDVIVVPECLQCPCNYIDFINSLTPQDRVTALLKDYTKTVIYRTAYPVQIF